MATACNHAGALQCRALAIILAGLIYGTPAIAQAQIILDEDDITDLSQIYNDAVILGSDVVLDSTAGDVKFLSTVDGAHVLDVRARSGAATFDRIGSTRALSGLIVDSSSFSATSSLAVAGDLSITAETGGIGQSEAWIVGGDTTLVTGDGDISLTDAGNDFEGVVTLDGGLDGGVSIRDSNVLELGLVIADSLEATAVEIKLAADIRTTANQSYSGAMSLTTDVSLTSTSGDISFGSTVDGAHALTVKAAGGTTTFNDAIGSNTALSGMSIESGQLNVASTLHVDGDLSIAVTEGEVEQSGAWIVSGITTLDAQSGDISLADAGNDFEGVVNLAGGNVVISDSNALMLGTLEIGSLTATSQGALELGSGSIAGVLDANSNGGGISQNGAIVVAGTTTLNAGSGAITLMEAGNDFQGALSLTGGSIAVNAMNDLMIETLSYNADGAVSLVAGRQLTLAAADIDTGAAALTLASNGGALQTTGTLRGSTISLTGASSLSLAHDVTASGVLTLASDADIAQTGGALSADQLVIEGDNAFLTSADNAISTLGSVVLTGDLSLHNTNTLILAADLTAGGTVDFVTDQAVLVQNGRTISAQETRMSGGLLQVDGQIDGSVTINSGATLGGGGTVGSTLIASGGVLAPGASIGTLSVAGDLTFASGSRYEVEVAPGGSASDLVAVTGTATLDGGTVAHIGMTGTYDPTATYTILSADGGLTVGSAFETVTSDFAFLDAVLGYSATDVTLTLTRNDIDFVEAGETPNQIATAGGIDSLTFGNDLYDAVVQLDGATAQAAFDQLSGEIHASMMSALIEDSRHVRNAANDRIRDAFAGVGASSAPVLAFGPDGPALAPASTNHGMAGWGAAFGSWGSIESDGNAASLDHSTGGLLVGADAMLGDWRLGLLAGYSRSFFDVDGQASSANSDNYHLGAYAGTQWAMPEGTLSLRGGAAYTWHDISTNRAVGFTGFTDSLSGVSGAGTFQVFGELGYGIDTEIARFEPFINLAHVGLRTDGFAESGGAAALTSSGQSSDITFTTLGVRAEISLVIGNTQATARGMVGWQHAFGDRTPLSTHAFDGSGAFTIAGSPIASDVALVEAGLDLNLTPDATLGLSYRGQFGANAQDHGFNVKLGVKF